MFFTIHLIELNQQELNNKILSIQPEEERGILQRFFNGRMKGLCGNGSPFWCDVIEISPSISLFKDHVVPQNKVGNNPNLNLGRW